MSTPSGKYKMATKPPDLSHKRAIGRALLIVFTTLAILGLVAFLAFEALVAGG
ncbi:MAG: hypothetical protein ABII72_03975 [Parcubacteria group bacterium]